MAVLTGTSLTLLDAAKRRNADGRQATIIEMLNQDNGILDEMVWRPTNEMTTHKVTVRTSLGEAYFKLIGEGVRLSKSTTAQIMEYCAKIEHWSEVDVDLADQEDDKEAFLMSEAQPAIETLNEKFCRYLIYGNRSTEPEAFTGFFPRLNALTGTENSKNVISAGGTGSTNTSILGVVWGDNLAHGIFPRNVAGGIQHSDEGKQTVQGTDSNSNETRRQVYRNIYAWNVGLSVPDWRAVCRIANIPSASLETFDGAANLTELMVQMWHRLRKTMKRGRPAIYMNADVAQALDIQRLRTLNGADSATGANLGGAISGEMVDGEMRYSFRGIPIRIVDQITNTEEAVA